jgi:hypothetical protein
LGYGRLSQFLRVFIVMAHFHFYNPALIFRLDHKIGTSKISVFFSLNVRAYGVKKGKYGLAIKNSSRLPVA